MFQSKDLSMMGISSSVASDVSGKQLDDDVVAQAVAYLGLCLSSRSNTGSERILIATYLVAAAAATIRGRSLTAQSLEDMDSEAYASIMRDLWNVSGNKGAGMILRGDAFSEAVLAIQETTAQFNKDVIADSDLNSDLSDVKSDEEAEAEGVWDSITKKASDMMKSILNTIQMNWRNNNMTIRKLGDASISGTGVARILSGSDLKINLTAIESVFDEVANILERTDFSGQRTQVRDSVVKSLRNVVAAVKATSLIKNDNSTSFVDSILDALDPSLDLHSLSDDIAVVWSVVTKTFDGKSTIKDVATIVLPLWKLIKSQDIDQDLLGRAARNLSIHITSMIKGFDPSQQTQSTNKSQQVTLS
jgi:hypothetical protein